MIHVRLQHVEVLGCLLVPHAQLVARLAAARLVVQRKPRDARAVVWRWVRAAAIAVLVLQRRPSQA